MTWPYWWLLKLSGNTQYAGVTLDQSGSGSSHATISITWIAICFTMHSNKYKISLETTNFSVFIAFFSSLCTNTTGITCAATMAAARGNGPLAPHMRPCALRRRAKWMDEDPPSKWVEFFGLLRVCMALKVLLYSGNAHCHNIGVFWGPYAPSTPPIIVSPCSGWVSPIHLTHWHGAQGLMWGARGPFLLAAVMVGHGCVGHGWPLEANVRSTYCRNSKYCLWK